MRGAGEKNIIADVLRHNGRIVEGEATFGVDADWKVEIPKLPISYQDVNGGETIRGRQMEAKTTALVTAAWEPIVAAITAKMRLKLEDGRTLEIVNALDLTGRRREITMQVSRVE